eukprot:1159420-Pelagomonas_calceolata.AAC.3
MGALMMDVCGPGFYCVASQLLTSLDLGCLRLRLFVSGPTAAQNGHAPVHAQGLGCASAALCLMT